MRPRETTFDRRRFLAWTSAAAALLAAHEASAGEAGSGLGPGTAGRARDERRPLLIGLELRSAASLSTMRTFYHERLGLPVLEDTPARLTIGAGATPLTFVPAAPEDGQPFYHFAFNIPENKVRAARDWQKARTPLLPIPARLRDPDYPDDVVDYRHWNAHSVFFFDPAGNVVEYIARHDLDNARPGGFGPGDILHASEIALVVDDVIATAATLSQVAGVAQYKGGGAQFTALGDEHGLLLVMERGRVISFDAPEKKPVSVFPTNASVRGIRSSTYRVHGFPYELHIAE